MIIVLLDFEIVEEVKQRLELVPPGPKKRSRKKALTKRRLEIRENITNKTSRAVKSLAAQIVE